MFTRFSILRVIVAVILLVSTSCTSLNLRGIKSRIFGNRKIMTGELTVNARSSSNSIIDPAKDSPSPASALKLLALDESTALEFRSREYLSSFNKLHKGSINAIETSNRSGKVVGPDLIYTGGQDGSIYELRYDENVSEGNVKGEGQKSRQVFKSINQLAKGTKPILALSLSQDRNYLAVSQFSLISIIDLSRRELVATFNQVKGRVLALAWDASGTALLLGRANGDIFSWNVGEDMESAPDSVNAMELYETESSPVVRIESHPSGRAIFVGLQSGAVYLVRLVKTERELGIRLDSQKAGMKQGRYVVRVGRLSGLLNDMFLDPVVEELMASGADGSIYRWRLRGLRQRPAYPVGSDSSGFMTLYQPDGDGSSRILSTLGRNLRLRFWCTNDEIYEVTEPTTSVLKQEIPGEDDLSGLDMGSPEDELLLQLKKEMLAEVSDDNDSGSSSGPSQTPGLIAETPRFIETVMTTRYSQGSGILWIGLKSGSLVGFEMSSFLASPELRSRVNALCKR